VNAGELSFRLPKPKSLPKGQVFMTKRPGLDKLVRSVKDALRGVLYRDDAQVVRLTASKTYHEQPGVEIRCQTSE
jgi:Holliday junction resolvase RusA-like endonuclease